MSNSKKTIAIIKDIELQIIGTIFANVSYNHDGFGRPTSHKYLSKIHTQLCSLPSMVKAKKEHDKKENFLCEEFGYKFTPLFRTVEQLEIRGQIVFDIHIKEQEERDNQHDADSCPTIADDENSKYFNFGKK